MSLISEGIIPQKSMFLASLLAGGAAGFVVDVSLFPIDTVKTRLQSKQGFIKAGGFNGVYRGLGAVVVGSVPTAALFFLTYEACKDAFEPMVHKNYVPFVHMLAASVGEFTSCLIRVPTEIAKQRRQALIGSNINKNGLRILIDAYKTEGIRKGLYRGFFSTVLRDLPFSFIQFPVWEYLKSVLAARNANNKIGSLEVALCGSVAGMLAGAIMTPLDVAKTRIMLAESHSSSARLGISHVLRSVYHEKGIRGLFIGILPRMGAFSLGGLIYFGTYDYVKKMCSSII